MPAANGSEARGHAQEAGGMKRTREGRLHMRIDSDILKKMKEYAQCRNLTLSCIVEQYFRHLLLEEERAANPVDAEQV